MRICFAYFKGSALKVKPHIPRIKFRYGKGRTTQQTPIPQQAFRPVSSSSGKILKSQEVVMREGPPRPYYRKKLTEEEIESINSGGAPLESKVEKTKPKGDGQNKKKPVKK
uniref:28S ribosomal protein S36, mitochondrial n=1 Tax=Lygus hesperus TaxID=30085 RepID=A0A0A9W910_LYGHE